VVFDEFDSIGRTRGNGINSEHGDGLVNQLLSKIDGVDSLDNILLIAMTNRRDAIDNALLRPGRLELHIEITVPDLEGRKQIFRIHTKELTKNDHLHSDVNFDELANLTVNYSGAEIKSVIDKASKYSLIKLIDPITMKRISNEKTIVHQEDFVNAIQYTVPIMGTTSRDVQIITRNPISLENVNYERIYNLIKIDLINFFTRMGRNQRFINGKKNVIGRNFSILLKGESYSGKTKMIAHIISELSNIISHLRFINPEYYINSNSTLWKEFQDGKRTDNFLMVIDSLETIIDFSVIGRDTQELKTILGCVIDNDKLVSTIVTCSDSELIQRLNISNKFMQVYDLSEDQEIDI
jgi:vesicle-fusing ATPase